MPLAVNRFEFLGTDVTVILFVPIHIHICEAIEHLLFDGVCSTVHHYMHWTNRGPISSRDALSRGMMRTVARLGDHFRFTQSTFDNTTYDGEITVVGSTNVSRFARCTSRNKSVRLKHFSICD